LTATRQIARALQISPYTVQEHLTSIFDKVGVRSRGELVGQVFFRHCLPAIPRMTSQHRQRTPYAGTGVG
jgi:hypothetical protein